MKYIIQEVWPTKILLKDNLLEEEYISSMRNELIKQSLENPRGNWQSNPKLHEQNKFKPLAREVLKLAKMHLQNDYYAVFENIEITDMWGNILKQKEFHRPHNHSNNIISGVYYIQADDNNSSKINFVDPRPQAMVIQPEVKKFTHFNSSVWFYPSVTNRCILFPSWLSHYVDSNITSEDRISIAFNFMLKGKLGKSTDLQSAEF